MSPYLTAASAGIRVTGAVIALGYLLGAVPGPLVAVAGGLALMTFGRALMAERLDAVESGIALAAVVGALVAGALRWGTLGLTELRGVQSVLGPTLLVGPEGAAAGAAIAAGAAVLGAAAWAPYPRKEGLGWRIEWGIEMGVVALAVVTLFWGPAISALATTSTGETAREVGVWLGAVALVGAVAAALSYVLARLKPFWRVLALCVAGAGAVAAAGILASVV